MLANDRLRLISIKIERANKHLDDLEAAVLSIGKETFNLIGLDSNLQTGKPILDMRTLNIYPAEIPAIAGDVVHNLRCALDHLAFHLVAVGISHGETAPQKWEDIQFPIFHSFNSYETGKGRRIQGMTREAKEAIDFLKPYSGGCELLWLLRKMDNTDKHSFILPIGEEVIVSGVSLKAYEPYLSSFGIPKNNQNMNFSGSESNCEPAVGRANTMHQTLHKLSHFISNTVTGFLPLLQDRGKILPIITENFEFSFGDDFCSTPPLPDETITS